LEEKDKQALKTVAVFAVVGIAAFGWGIYNGFFPEKFSAPIRAAVPGVVFWVAVLVALVLSIRFAFKRTHSRKQERNSVFASFMGAHWDGKTGVTVSMGRGGVPRKIKIKLPSTQPLFDPKFQERLTQAGKARMGTDLITAEPDLARHTMTFRPLTESQKQELTKVNETQSLSAAFQPVMGNDWDKRSGITWGTDPRVTPKASHGFTKVKVAVPGKWSLADDEIRDKLKNIAATKLGTTDIAGTFDAVGNVAEFSVYEVTAEIAAERRVEERIADLEDKFRAFFAKPVKATVKQWDTETGEPLAFTLAYESQRGDYLESFARKLEQGATVKMGRRMVVTLHPKSRQVDFEPQAELASLITHPGISLYEEDKSGKSLLHLGEDIMGEIASWELSASSVQPHAIFAGATRSGKSASMRNIVLGCAWHGIEMILLDPKYKEFVAYQGFPNIRSIATSTEQIMAAIEFVHDRVMEPRYKQAAYAKQQGNPEPDFPPFVLAIDEYIVLVREMKAWWKVNKEKGDPTEPPALEMMTKMLVKAAGANVHILMGMQRMDVEFIPGAARDQVSFRLALGKISPTLANMAFDNYYAGADMPLLQGRGLANPDGNVREIQVFKIDEPANVDTADQAINKAFMDKANQWDKTKEWITPKGKFDTDLAAEVNSVLLRAVAEAKNPPPAPDAPAAPALVGEIEVPTVSVAVGLLVAGDTIRNAEGMIGTITEVEEVTLGDEIGVEITAIFGKDVVTEAYTEDSVIDRVDVIPDELNQIKETA
jgi:hypothetical protein